MFGVKPKESAGIGWVAYAIENPDEDKISRHLLADGVVMQVAKAAAQCARLKTTIEEKDWILNFRFKSRQAKLLLQLDKSAKEGQQLVSTIWVLKIVWIKLPAAAGPDKGAPAQVVRDARKRLKTSAPK